MREPGELAAAFPRPGRALKVVLASIALVAVASWIVTSYAPGGAAGKRIVELVVFDPSRVLTRPWTLLTSGFVTGTLSHTIWSLVGLYFLTPVLEKRWSGKRLFRFLALSIVFGNLFVLAGTFVPVRPEVFQPGVAFGPLAAIAAVTIAFARDNQRARLQFLFFIPMTGKTLFWATLGLAIVLPLVFGGTAEGALAPLGGIAAGMLFGGTPSMARKAYLQAKLAFLRRRAGSLTVDDILGPPPSDAPKSKKRSPKPGAPALRILPGGLEDELKNRKPPKDKRYLN